jgi:hypothetical protein
VKISAAKGSGWMKIDFFALCRLLNGGKAHRFFFVKQANHADHFPEYPLFVCVYNFSADAGVQQ